MGVNEHVQRTEEKVVAEVADGNCFVCNAGGKVPFLEICPNKRVVWRSPAVMSIPLVYVRRGNGGDDLVRRNRFVRWIFRAEVPSDCASWQLVEERDPSPRRLRSPSLVGRGLTCSTWRNFQAPPFT